MTVVIWSHADDSDAKAFVFLQFFCTVVQDCVLWTVRMFWTWCKHCREGEVGFEPHCRSSWALWNCELHWWRVMASFIASFSPPRETRSDASWRAADLRTVSKLCAETLARKGSCRLIVIDGQHSTNPSFQLFWTKRLNIRFSDLNKGIVAGQWSIA
jgi:hypothetical protein